MLVAPDKSSILDQFPRWSGNTGAPGIWRLAAPFGGDPEVLPFAQDIHDGKLVSGERGWFGVWTTNDASDGFVLYACKFDEPSQSFARSWWSRSSVGHDGDSTAWANLQPFYLANNPEFPLAFALTSDGVLRPLNFDWYNDREYDRGYEYLSCLVREPSTGGLLVGMYRSGNIIVCDSETGEKKWQTTLPNRHHSSKLFVGPERDVLWAMGYDTIFRLTLPELEIQASRLVQGAIQKRIQGAEMSISAFAGDMVLQSELNRVCVARPYSGDVQALDVVSLEPIGAARTGGEPLDLAVVDDLAIAREWKTGNLLRGRIEEIS